MIQYAAKELLTESYCLLAPKKLVALLGAARPPDEQEWRQIER